MLFYSKCHSCLAFDNFDHFNEGELRPYRYASCAIFHVEIKCTFCCNFKNMNSPIFSYSAQSNQCAPVLIAKHIIACLGLNMIL
jgi:hypothetical protein